MIKIELKNQIVQFKIATENYRRIILNENGSLSYDVRSRMIELQRSQLNQSYGKLEKYIDKAGGNLVQTYLTAFGDGTYSDTINALSSVVQNLDRIIGQLEVMTDKDYADSFNVKHDISKSDSASNVSMRLGILEFITPVLFAISFTLIFAMTKILGLTFYWSAIWPYLLFFSWIMLSAVYIILPIIEISRKVGINVQDIYGEFVIEFKSKSRLGKFKTVGTIVVGIMGIIPTAYWVFSAIMKDI